MNYKETVEDEGFVYELSVLTPKGEEANLHTISQGNGFYCQWNITIKQDNTVRQIAVTDDDCEVIVFDSLEAAVRGAKAFLSL